MRPRRMDRAFAHRVRPVAALLASTLLLAVTGPGAVARPPAPMLDAIVHLASSADLGSLRGLPPAERQALVEATLREHAASSQAPLLAALARGQADGTVARVTSLWVVNAIAVTARPAVLDALANDPAVAAIVPDARIAAPAPLSTDTGAVEPNVDIVGAPALWSLGVDGTGIVVASLDTGVDASHPDLASRWRGGSDSWFDPNGQHPTVPTDLSGHGTGTMGVIVGGSAGGSAIGIAPGARWIAAKIFNDAGYATTSGIHAAYQWLLDPDGDPATPDAPDVVNNSWASATPGCSLEFEPDLAALRAAGILPVFAAGNTGPSASSSVSPANNPSALAVGAVDDTGAIDPESARGPNSCGQASTWYPELVAPGVGIRTDDLLGGFQSATGTSLAAPHVTGAVALLRQAYPGLDPALAEAALAATAVDLGPAGPDSTYGAGRLDIAAAYQWLTTADTSAPSVAGASGSPSPSLGAASVTITATASDAGSATSTASGIAAAEWWRGADPGPGHGSPMLAADGSFGSASETVVAMMATSGLPYGEQLVGVRALDGSGNWSAATMTAVLVTPVDTVFADGFESGGSGAWSSVSGSSRLAVTTSSALAGGFGLQVTLDPKVAAYVTDTSPSAEAAYRGRFALEPGSSVTGTRVVDLFDGLTGTGGALFRVDYRRLAGGAPEVRLTVTLKRGTASTPWRALAPGAHAIEVAWASGRSVTASLAVDGAVLDALSGIDTGTGRLEAVRLGAVSGLGKGVTGLLGLDRFVSTRTTTIGP